MTTYVYVGRINFEMWSNLVRYFHPDIDHGYGPEELTPYHYRQFPPLHQSGVKP